MSYDDEGYTKKTVEEIIADKEELYADLFDIVNYSISDVTWQWMKLQAIERNEIESLNEVSTEQMSISTAQGAFLDKWGEECGIPRKGETNSEGYVEVTAVISGIAFSILAGTEFTSQTKSYISDEADEVPYGIEMVKTKTGESDDYFPTDIESIGAVVEILDGNNNIISSSYYTLDTTYKNNIQWTVASSAVLVIDETYTVRVSGSVVKRVEVTSVETGEDSVGLVNTVNTCIDYPSLTVNNSEEISGGASEESDDNYRIRLLEARRRTFTLDSIKSIILGLEGVRAVKVYQDVGTDQTSVDDWDNPIGTSELSLTGWEEPMYSQSFVPGDLIATLGRITIRGTPYNDPPAIYCGIKGDFDSFATGDYFDYISVEKYEIDQTVTGERDIEFNIKYNGMDKTKTYRFDLWCDNPENASFDWTTHYWKILTTTEQYRTDNRGMFYKYIGGSWVAQGNTVDIMFKSSFNGAGFTSIISPEDGYGFENIKAVVGDYLDYIDGGGYSPICIQSTILESDEILIDIRGTIYVTALADFQNVRREITTSLETYLENLTVGDNVIYSKIFQIIMDHTQVYKLKDLETKREDSLVWGEIDIGILDSEIPDLGTRSFQSGT